MNTNGEIEMEESKRRVSLLAVFSLVLLLFPYIALPMAIISIYKISKSQGRLYGKTAAWIAVVVNTVLLLLIVAGLVMTTIFGPRPIQTSPFGEIPISGRAVWNIDGQDYRIEGTCVAILPKGDNTIGSVMINGQVSTTSQENELLYVVKVLVNFDVSSGGHEELARKIAAYACQEDFYDKANRIHKGGQPVALSGNIGVALIRQVSSIGGLMSSNSVYQYKVPLSEIRGDTGRK